MRCFLCLLFLLPVATGFAQSIREIHHDEARVPAYRLPDLLHSTTGTPIATSRDWERERPALLRLFAENVYGRTPVAAQQKRLQFEVTSTVKNARNGTATRKEITGWIDRASGRQMRILLYLPNRTTGRVPVILGLNFFGNHTIDPDPSITLSPEWMPANDAYGVVDHRATEKSRGVRAYRWPIDSILARGYGLATVYCGDLDPDFHDNFQNGIHPLFYRAGQTRPDSSEWGTIGTWAWGLSRALDYLETDPGVDGRRVAVLGHSRLGKAALWAGAQDPRFAMVLSNESGEGGTALARRQYGETTARINTSFPHWFCDRFKTFNDREEALPVDQHQLLALIAPRPLYVASADGDQWSDPKGEFLAAQAASPAYELYGKKGLTGTEFPGLDRPVGSGQVRYHVRSGKHEITAFDWTQYLNFADAQWGKPNGSRRGKP